MHASSYTATARVPVGVYLQGRVLVFVVLAFDVCVMLYYIRSRKTRGSSIRSGAERSTIMTKKEIIKETATPAQDLFDGLTEEAASTMTVWSATLQSNLDRAGSIKFAEGKRAKALEAVYMWAQGQKELNPIVMYVITMGLKTLNRKVGK